MNSTESLSAPESSCLSCLCWPVSKMNPLEIVLSTLASFSVSTERYRPCFCSFLTANFVESSMTRLFAGTPFDIPPRCDRCGELEESCQCEPAGPERLPPEKQTAKVRVDRRKHKRMVTVVWGLDPVACDLAELLSTLKAACGSGGSLQDDEIELQGDHLTRVKENLRKLGYKVAK